MSLYRLVYFSENKIVATNDELRAEIGQILTTSRRNNNLVDVTGALMFSTGYFGQVLEGPQAAIEVTFERIQQDPRHANVSLLEFIPVARRGFQTWAMAYVGKDGEAVGADLQNTGLDLAAISGEILFSKLHSLVAKTRLDA